MRKEIKHSGLFDRLTALEDEHRGQYTPANGKEAMYHAIRTNLGRVLNSRAGNSLSNENLGLVDFNDAQLTSNDMKINICKNIKTVIEAYEPRISAVEVTSFTDNDSPLSLHFKLVGYIKLEDQSSVVEFDLMMEKGRAWRIL